MTDSEQKSAFKAAARWTTATTRNVVVGVGIGLGLVSGALALQTAQQTVRLNNTMQFVAAQPEKGAPTARDLSFGPFTEAADQRIFAKLALKLAPNNQTVAYARLSEMGNSHYAIMRNAVVLEEKLLDCRITPGTCSPALNKFRQLIDTSRTISDPTTKALLVNAWVNTAIAYDNGLIQSQKTSKPRPAPDLVETLESGKGICDQQAQLKLYALSRAGIAQQDLRYVALMVVKDGKWVESHAVVLARLDGKTSVLNGQQYDRDMPNHAKASDEQRLAYNSALQDPRALLNIDHDALFRQGGTTLLPLYSANYVTAQPYQGMQDSEKPPYYRGSPFARHLISPRVTVTDVPNLTVDQQLNIGRTLMDALQFQNIQQSTLTLPTTTINAAAMKAAERRPKGTGTRSSEATPGL